MALDTFGLPPLTDLDPDDAIKSEHMTKTRASVNHNYAYIGGNNYTPAEDHAHTGADAAQVDFGDLSGTAAAINRNALKIAGETQSLVYAAATSTHVTFSATDLYGFHPVFSNGTSSNTLANFTAYRMNQYPNLETTGQNRMHLAVTGTVSVSSTFFVACNYIQASPPHTFLDDDDHGLWVYVLHDEKDQPQRGWSAGDPPWWLSGFRKMGELGKKDPGRFWVRPNPFADDVPVLPQGWKVRLYDLRHLNEFVGVTPAADRFEEFEAEGHKKYKARGISTEEITAWAGELRAAAEKEKADGIQAEVDMSYLDVWLPERLKQIRRHRRVSKERRQELLNIETARAMKMREKLEAKRTRMRVREYLATKYPEGDAGGVLGAILSGDIKVFDDCTRCLTSSSTHKDRGRLPRIFRGKNPTVQVMTRK